MYSGDSIFTRPTHLLNLAIEATTCKITSDEEMTRYPKNVVRRPSNWLVVS